MAPYFGCFSCEDTRKGLKAIDFDADGEIHWNEFMVYIKWALREYSDDIETVDNLLSLTFRKGIIPAMQDVVLGRSDKPDDKRKISEQEVDSHCAIC